MPPRDRGPVRKFVRNYVDSRINIGEYFLPFIFVVLLMSLTRNQNIAILSILLMYSIMLIAIVDGLLLGRRIKKQVKERFPNESTRGLAIYAFLRSTQMRRMRAPAPQVKRGDKNFQQFLSSRFRALGFAWIAFDYTIQRFINVAHRFLAQFNATGLYVLFYLSRLCRANVCS